MIDIAKINQLTLKHCSRSNVDVGKWEGGGATWFVPLIRYYSYFISDDVCYNYKNVASFPGSPPP